MIVQLRATSDIAAARFVAVIYASSNQLVGHAANTQKAGADTSFQHRGRDVLPEDQRDRQLEG